MEKISQKVVLIVGAMKSATTTLYTDIGSHPRVLAPDLKEPFHLVEKVSLDDMLSLIRSHFNLSKLVDGILIDGSTGYTMLPDYSGAALMASKVYNNVAKIIYLIRDPFERAISHYKHSVLSGDMFGDFKHAIKRDERLLNYSRYYYQIQPWLEVFDSNRVLVVTMDYWKEHRQEIANLVWKTCLLEDEVHIDLFTHANKKERRRFPLWLNSMLRRFGSGGIRFIYNSLPAFARTKIAKVFLREVDLPNAEFDSDLFDWYWSQVYEDLELIVPLIQHPVSDPKTIWNYARLKDEHVVE